MSDTTQDRIWWFAVDQQKSGPYTRAELQEQARQGRFGMNDHVWHNGLTEWMPARDVPGLWQSAGLQPVADAAPPPAPVGWSPSAAPLAAQGTQRMGFITAVQTCLRKYADFSGRASRSEYFWFLLFYYIVALPAALLLSEEQATALTLLSAVAVLAFSLPMYAVGARRLHDTGLSGWWQLLHVFSIIGSVIVLVLTLRQGEPGRNKYGPPLV